jgi:hypothetical protein
MTGKHRQRWRDLQQRSPRRRGRRRHAAATTSSLRPPLPPAGPQGVDTAANGTLHRRAGQGHTSRPLPASRTGDAANLDHAAGCGQARTGSLPEASTRRPSTSRASPSGWRSPPSSPRPPASAASSPARPSPRLRPRGELPGSVVCPSAARRPRIAGRCCGRGAADPDPRLAGRAARPGVADQGPSDPVQPGGGMWTLGSVLVASPKRQGEGLNGQIVSQPGPTRRHI